MRHPGPVRAARRRARPPVQARRRAPSPAAPADGRGRCPVLHALTITTALTARPRPRRHRRGCANTDLAPTPTATYGRSAPRCCACTTSERAARGCRAQPNEAAPRCRGPLRYMVASRFFAHGELDRPHPRRRVRAGAGRSARTSPGAPGTWHAGEIHRAWMSSPATGPTSFGRSSARSASGSRSARPRRRPDGATYTADFGARR